MTAEDICFALVAGDDSAIVLHHFPGGCRIGGATELPDFVVVCGIYCFFDYFFPLLLFCLCNLLFGNPTLLHPFLTMCLDFPSERVALADRRSDWCCQPNPVFSAWFDLTNEVEAGVCHGFGELKDAFLKSAG